MNCIIEAMRGTYSYHMELDFIVGIGVYWIGPQYRGPYRPSYVLQTYEYWDKL